MALRAYVRQLRRQGSESVDASAPAPFDRSKHLPLVEMNWEQYSSWARYGNALATRDYQRVEETLPRIEDLFGPDVANQLADAVVEDYREYLTAIIETECEGQDPQSVWRKTLFMPFLLARLERPSPELDRMGVEARTHCGYDG